MDVRRLNDQALEWLILILRWYTVLAGLATVALLTIGALRVQVDIGATRYVIAAGVTAGSALLSGGLGWFWLGNSEWRREPRTLAGSPCGAHYQGLICDVQVDAWGVHDGRHQDGVRDPEGAQLWS